MAKRVVVVDPAKPVLKNLKATGTNWELCAICQNVSKEALQSPANATKGTGAGYKSLATHLQAFAELNEVPIELIQRLDEGNGIEMTLTDRSAKWHKTCRLKYNQIKLDRVRKKAEKGDSGASSSVTGSTRASFDSRIDQKEQICFVCEKPSDSSGAGLHNASTYDIDSKVRKCALELEDSVLLAKLAAGDMIALEAKYHSKCLAGLYNKTRAARNESKDNNPDECLHGIAFAELVSYMDEMRNEEGVAPIFRMTDLAFLYKERLEQLGVSLHEGRIHTTRLKLRLLSVFPDLVTYTEGRNTLVTFDHVIGSALRQVCDYDSEAMHLAKAAEIVRKDIFGSNYSFNGSFSRDCQQQSVPKSLQALVSIILEGPNIKHQSAVSGSAATLTASQLLVFNCVKRSSTAKTTTTRHNPDRETPLPLYVALKIHSATRNRSLVDTLFSLGMCVSYDRLLQITADVANGVCQQFTMDGVVCPPKMRQGLFTTAAVDNIDHNPSSATAKGSFHGTGISLFQHPTHDFAGNDRGVVVLHQEKASSKRVVPLPASYSQVPPVVAKATHLFAPKVDGPCTESSSEALDQYADIQGNWLRKVESAARENATNKEWLSWSAYHASIQQDILPPSAIGGLLPLFMDSAHSLAMIKHAMNVISAAVRHLNPSQVPVMTADQPLFSLAKQVQWIWPDRFGENHFVIMLGGLHIEMATLKVKQCLYVIYCQYTSSCNNVDSCVLKILLQYCYVM